MRLSSITLLFALITCIHAVPLASPETRGASGECSPPEVEILSTEKQKQGPYLVSGARSDANPRGGRSPQSVSLRETRILNLCSGVASFGNLWSVTYTYQYGGGLDISKYALSISHLTLNLSSPCTKSDKKPQRIRRHLQKSLRRPGLRVLLLRRQSNRL